MGNVAAGIGGNLIAAQVQRWCDESEATSEETIQAWIADNLAVNAELREALDAILERLDTFTEAKAGLTPADRDWFEQTLRAELTADGKLARFEAHLSGSGGLA